MSENLELHEGQWRPSVPLPFFGWLHVQCWNCRKRFPGGGMSGRGRHRYEEHYRREHLSSSVLNEAVERLRLDSQPRPGEEGDSKDHGDKGGVQARGHEGNRS